MTTRKRRFLTLLAAHVALLGIVFQIAALDHWRPQIEDIRGIEATHFHESHCHGSASSCGEGGGAGFWVNAQPASVPAPPASRPVHGATSDVAPPAAPLADLLHPPRAA
jgi:hypothetical protein